jgi:hypothetical protein
MCEFVDHWVLVSRFTFNFKKQVKDHEAAIAQHEVVLHMKILPYILWTIVYTNILKFLQIGLQESIDMLHAILKFVKHWVKLRRITLNHLLQKLWVHIFGILTKLSSSQFVLCFFLEQLVTKLDALLTLLIVRILTTALFLFFDLRCSFSLIILVDSFLLCLHESLHFLGFDSLESFCLLKFILIIRSVTLVIILFVSAIEILAPSVVQRYGFFLALFEGLSHLRVITILFGIITLASI